MRYIAKTIALMSLSFVLLTSPVAAFASTLSLSPSTGTFNRSCPFSLQIKLDTGGVQTDGTDAILLYDNSRLTATSVAPGTIYADYPGTNVDDTSGKVTVSGLASVSQPFSGQGVFATVNFTVKDNAPTGATQVKFDFDPNNMAKTTDSNVVQRGTVQDTLSSVVNGNYTVGTGTCASPSPSSVIAGGPGGAVSTPAAQPKPFQTLDQAAGSAPGGNSQWTATMAILGSALTILGILGLALF